MKKKNSNNGEENRSRKPPKIEMLFCDSRDASYWYPVNGRFLKMGTRDVRMHLRADYGLNEKFYFQTENGSLRELDYPLYSAQKNFLIDYAGPLAGHRVGVFSSGGRKFLVTEQPTLFEQMDKTMSEKNEAGKAMAGYEIKKGRTLKIADKVKKPKFFLEFLHELLGDNDQWQFFSHWLAIALASLRRGDFRPGQVCVFAGPSECGKSLLQSIVTEILGGRSANPFRYMMGESQFNADLAWGEHWQIEDPASTTDIRTRRLFGSKLKECTVNRDFSIHQKGKDALLLPVFRRVTISVNDEPENLSVIPPPDESIKDKIFLFKCAPVVKAFEQFKDERGELDRKKLWEHVLSEIPAIRAWLLNGLPKLPKEFRNVRFGIKAWHHPELLAELENLSPEMRLLTLLDEALFDADDEEKDLSFFEGKAIDVEKKLRDSKFTFEAEKILKYNGACGAYLGRLAKSHPDRISKRVKHGYTFWRIEKPKADDDKNQMTLGVAAFAEDAGLIKK